MVPAQPDIDFWAEEVPDELRARYAFEYSRAVEDSASEIMRRATAATHVAMYENAAVPLMPVGATSTMVPLWTLYDRKVWNVLRSVISAYAATISRSRPRPRFLASGGTGRTHRAVKKMQYLNDGIFSENDVYELGRMVCVDDALMGGGVLQVCHYDGRVKIERILPTEILIDASAGFNGFNNAQVIGRKRLIDKTVLLDEFGDSPEKQMAIIHARSEDPSGNGLNTRMVPVYELYRRSLPSKDGFHAIVIPGNEPGCLLRKEKWKVKWVPFVLLVSDPAITGVWGRSLAEGVAPIQLMIDNLLTRIHRSIKLACVPRWWLPKGAKINRSGISNDIGSFIEGTGGAPQALTVQALSREPYDMLNQHVQQAYELCGINQNAAAGQREAGLESGEAVRSSMEIQQNRLAVRQARYEAFFVELAKIAVNMAKLVYGSNKSYSVVAKVPGYRFLQTIDWSEVADLTETDFVVDTWPENLLSQTPADRIDTVTNLVRGGVWDQDRAQAALDDLDPEAEFSFERAAEMRISQQIENILIDGKAELPTEYDNLALALKNGVRYLKLGELEDVPEKNLDLLRVYLDEVKRLQGKINGVVGAAAAGGPEAQAAPPPGAGGGAPPAPEAGAIPPVQLAAA